VSVETTDSGSGLTWTVTTKDPAGDIPTLGCAGDAAFAESSAACAVATVIDGNVIEGTFVLEGSDPLPYDATAAAVARALGETAAETVEVSREGPDAQQGYVWSVTFVERAGAVPLLDVVSSLTGSGAAVDAREAAAGNALTGGFALQTLSGFTTPQMPYDVDAAGLEAALEAMSGVGSVSVSGGDAPSTEGGAAYEITFTSAEGDVANLVPVLYNLSGTDAVAHVRETVKGSEARGDALALSFRAPRECSESQVTARSCGEAVTEFQLQTSVTASFEGDGLMTYAIPADNSVGLYGVRKKLFPERERERGRAGGRLAADPADGTKRGGISPRNWTAAPAAALPNLS